ncbi:hypothetical protein K492DRAFT_208097 [Lichtheimia hyalospora FSU 10163]|nr:hypothetical protein K492DRAFT_208097 [Lichtheimia hyalospora FSU 10163]
MAVDGFNYKKLSNELVDFVQYLEPTATEKRDRSYAFKEIKRAIEREIESSEVHAFGSYETGLLLPSSDIDMRVSLGTELEPVQVRQLMQRLTKAFRRKSRRDLYRQVMFIPAKATNSTISSTRTLQWMQEHKELKPIYLFMKFVLLRIQLADDPNYCLISAKTSGLAGYALVCMIVHYIKYQAKRNALDPNAPDYLGRLLMGILKFYGTFDYTAQALQFDETEFFTKPDTSEWKHHHKFIIHDPDQPGINVARSTTTMNRIRAVFDWIRRELLTRKHASLIGPLVTPSWRFGARNRQESYRDDRYLLTARDIQLEITRAAKNYGQNKRKREELDNEDTGYRSQRDNTNNTKRTKQQHPREPRQRDTREQRQSPSNQNNHARTKNRWSRQYKAARKRQSTQPEKPARYLYSRYSNSRR